MSVVCCGHARCSVTRRGRWVEEGGVDEMDNRDDGIYIYILEGEIFGNFTEEYEFEI